METKLPLPEDIVFDTDSPFYSMVIAGLYLIPGIEAISDEKNRMEYTPKQYGRYHGKQGIPLDINMYDLHKHALIFARQSEFMKNVNAHVCCMLANTAYETVKDQNDGSEIFEVFYHLRNAASHNNKFHFTNGQPKNPASWRGFTIDYNKKGSDNPLHGVQCFNNYFAFADLCYLLSDIEKKIKSTL